MFDFIVFWLGNVGMRVYHAGMRRITGRLALERSCEIFTCFVWVTPAIR